MVHIELTAEKIVSKTCSGAYPTSTCPLGLGLALEGGVFHALL